MTYWHDDYYMRIIRKIILLHEQGLDEDQIFTRLHNEGHSLIALSKIMASRKPRSKTLDQAIDEVLTKHK